MAEPIITDRLSQVGISPKVLGVFNKGIIVEFIPNTIATVEELSSLELSKAVLRKLALFNSQKMPISKNPMLLIEKIEEAANMPMKEHILKINFILQNVPLEIAKKYKLRKEAVLKTYGHVIQ
ncbi:choline kinase alpha-like isoform X1 [Leptotrombidium deliense]|uniref:Choline kinase alpha-like isoform X1 n=1 Tax=Leptotrombidium deliense TaxID=299467 RepID=A0A443RZL9_9ACAR|nr:choline kinase alpha-like isoform X1 [Leptotrombidium deliense]